MTAAESLRDVLQLINDGVLVRNIECDADPEAFLRQAVRLINTLATANELAAPASGVEFILGVTAQPKISEAFT